MNDELKCGRCGGQQFYVGTNYYREAHPIKIRCQSCNRERFADTPDEAFREIAEKPEPVK